MPRRYKCVNCGNIINVTGDVCRCPECDGKLIPVTPPPEIKPSCKIQLLVLEDGTEELLVSGRTNTYAFRYERVNRDESVTDWEPMGLVDVFRPFSHIKDSVGRIF